VLHVLSSLVLVLILVGVMMRRRRRVHIGIMSGAFAVDLTLLLYIEFTRSAVEKVATGVSPLVYVHAAIALAVMILYVVMIVLGRKALRGDRASRSTHRVLGVSFVALRGLTYVTALVM
jgi:hypothetical protein